jgi:hypothetical protein
MMINGAVGGIIDRGVRSTPRKLAPISLQSTKYYGITVYKTERHTLCVTYLTLVSPYLSHWYGLHVIHFVRPSDLLHVPL